MDLLPRPRRLPVSQPPPAGHPGPAAYLLGQVLPGAAADQHEDDSRQGHAIGNPGPSGLLRGTPSQVRLDQLPQRIVQQRLRHRRTSLSDGRSYAGCGRLSCVLLEALRTRRQRGPTPSRRGGESAPLLMPVEEPLFRCATVIVCTRISPGPGAPRLAVSEIDLPSWAALGEGLFQTPYSIRQRSDDLSRLLLAVAVKSPHRWSRPPPFCLPAALS